MLVTVQLGDVQVETNNELYQPCVHQYSNQLAVGTNNTCAVHEIKEIHPIPRATVSSVVNDIDGH